MVVLQQITNLVTSTYIDIENRTSVTIVTSLHNFRAFIYILLLSYGVLIHETWTLEPLQLSN